MLGNKNIDNDKSAEQYEETPFLDLVLYVLVLGPLTLLSIEYVGGKLAGSPFHGEASGLQLLVFPILVLSLPFTVPVFSRSLTRRTSALRERKLSIRAFMISPPALILVVGAIYFLVSFL